MRLAAGIALIVHGIAALRGGPPLGSATLHVATTGAGILLLAGLWTPTAGALVAAIPLHHTFSRPGEPWGFFKTGTRSAALSKLRPGACGAGLCLFGCKRPG